MIWVKDIMTPISGSLTETDTCREALRRVMDEEAAGWPVADSAGEFVGIATPRALGRLLKEEGPETSCLGGVEFGPIAFKATLPLETAWSRTFQVAAVSGEDGQIVGILSRSALAVALYQRAEFQVKELEAVLNSAHNGIVVINREGMITSFNRAAERFTHVPKEKALGRHVLDVLIPLGLMETLQTGQSEYSQKFRVGRHTYIMNRDPVKQEGKITGAVGVFQDISEIESVSQELASVKALNRELDSVIQSSSDGFVVTDAAGIIIRTNAAFEKMSLSTAQELLGRRIQELGDGEVYAHSLLDVVLQRKHPVSVTEKKQDHSFLVTGSPVFDEEGRLVRVVINLRDMTMLNQLRQELLESKRLSEKYHLELAELRQRGDTGGMIASSPEMEEVLELIQRVAKVDSTVLLLGESGVGKEGMAKLLHSRSPRAEGPFIKVNCGAIPEQLLESELFGYESGAFTGARREGKIGMFELAHNGTLLLDEIGDLPFNLQAKLLRVLQEREVVPVGGSKPRRVNVRILAATHKDLEEMVRLGKLREDLFFRLNVVPIWIPPLRERRADIIPLLHHFRERFCKKYGLQREFAPDAVEAFYQYDWPGNVRELENMVERLIVMAPGELITLSLLPPVFQSPPEEGGGVSVRALMPLKEAVLEVERQLIERAMAKYGSTYKAAEALGVNQSTVVRRLAKLRRKATNA
ncbi:RNA polymerase sigma factor 54 interaction domain protein [Acididesulfobacillus acetoxydans]|uniref:HTH-type transcriptional regulatory protein TyrR n=1 Tax=Acididesulfobacillus acetoxydans TaxID=1561005 RepID=A0A8S0VWR4_9FIRM|nr:sigma 54-interacting transcriptional regulator [Acididesulfobacillus acetoxydans]CAA7601143.1 RNA polymerase sigma factor 54 interaction domain protein [Acididesulfobacillus acetoxydans]CEJ08578.1 Acetoacetate metabolism regulatory protein AtoC [Acididesulfobacillus acetoxydans]